MRLARQSVSQTQKSASRHKQPLLDRQQTSADTCTSFLTISSSRTGRTDREMMRIALCRPKPTIPAARRLRRKNHNKNVQA
ncbi:hypothetical protein L596_024137 [Steinernema carpocapsae]|uniref:Uncharacterized protein n=1 Tax=Steinernema carpocapsae TaxID=34508 RepID=A0A4U5MFW0_STECR|nr:hypothetical protein L596_024137 [Steinernema carpocapsae]